MKRCSHSFRITCNKSTVTSQDQRISLSATSLPSTTENITISNKPALHNQRISLSTTSLPSTTREYHYQQQACPPQPENITISNKPALHNQRISLSTTSLPSTTSHTETSIKRLIQKKIACEILVTRTTVLQQLVCINRYFYETSNSAIKSNVFRQNSCWSTWFWWKPKCFCLAHWKLPLHVFWPCVKYNWFWVVG